MHNMINGKLQLAQIKDLHLEMKQKQFLGPIWREIFLLASMLC